MDNCFEWYTSECAPLGYPSEIVGGHLVLYNGIKHEILTRQYSHNGWGNNGSEFYLGTDPKPVPAYLYICYISFVEQKAYSGEVYFDKDRLIPLFQAEIISPLNNNETIQYKQILIGTAPLGNVSIWLYGDTNAREVMQFRCKEDHQFDIHDYVVGYKDLSHYCKKTLAENNPEIAGTLMTGVSKVPSTATGLNRWGDLYRRAISLQLEFHLLGEVENFQVWFFNGESEYYFPANKKNTFEIGRVPSELLIQWKKDDEEEVQSIFTLDEDLIFSLFEDSNSAKNMRKLIIQLREQDDSVKGYLISQDKTIDVGQHFTQ